MLSILYLAVETRNNTNTIQSQTSQGLLELSNSYQLEVIGNPELGRLLWRGYEEPESLIEVERFRFELEKRSQFNRQEQAFNSYINGTLTDEIWGGWDWATNSNQFVCREGNLYFWEGAQGSYGRSFTAYVDKIIEDKC